MYEKAARNYDVKSYLYKRAKEEAKRLHEEAAYDENKMPLYIQASRKADDAFHESIKALEEKRRLQRELPSKKL